jgi:hypothetical protein
MGKLLEELNCIELKSELGKRSLSRAGSKNELVLRLHNYLEQQGEDVNTFVFETEVEEEKVSESVDFSSMMKLLLEQRNEQKKEQQNVLEQLNAQQNEQKKEQQNILERLEGQENVLEGQKNILEGKLGNIEKNVCVLDERVEGVEKQLSVVENRFEIVESRCDKQFSVLTKELDQIRKIKIRESAGELAKKKEMKPPTFDGQSSWPVYKRQFEAAATTNGWDDEDKYIALTLALRGPAAELLQTVPAGKSGDFSSLVAAIDKRFGDSHLKEVFRVQLNNRVQKRGESLQQLQADVERLVHLAYPDAGEEIINQLAVESFVRAISDIHLQRSVRSARTRTLSETLAFALTIEAAEQASHGIHRLREAIVEECSCQRAEVQKIQRSGLARCWNCNKTGHLQRQCRLPPNKAACQHCGSKRSNPEQGNNNTNVAHQVVSHQGNE